MSNIFVNPATLPGWLRGVSDVNPLSRLVIATRTLLASTATTPQVLWAVAAAGVMIAVFAPLTALLYQRRLTQQQGPRHAQTAIPGATAAAPTEARHSGAAHVRLPTSRPIAPQNWVIGMLRPAPTARRSWRISGRDRDSSGQRPDHA